MIFEWRSPQNVEADTTIFDAICHHHTSIFSLQSIHSPQKSYFLFLMVVNQEIANFSLPEKHVSIRKVQPAWSK